MSGALTKGLLFTELIVVDLGSLNGWRVFRPQVVNDYEIRLWRQGGRGGCCWWGNCSGYPSGPSWPEKGQRDALVGRVGASVRVGAGNLKTRVGG